MGRPADEERKPFQGLPRSFRLKRQSLIRPLFDRTRKDVGTVSHGCIRILYRIVSREATGSGAPLQVGVSAGRIPKAVRRNRIKRVIREVYRVHQQDLVDLFHDTETTLTMMILYRGGAAGETDRIRSDLPAALHVVVRRLNESSMRAEQRR